MAGDCSTSWNWWWRVQSRRKAADGIRIDDALVSRFIQANLSRYDKTGDTHYDIASALIKSIRSSDPDGAVYWLARMIEGGEDPKFIARRLLISASEDIGHANPTALVLANATFDAVERLGGSGVPHSAFPMRDLPRVEPQVQQRLCGHWHGPEGRPGPRRPAGSGALAQRADETDEGPRLMEAATATTTTTADSAGRNACRKGWPVSASSVPATRRGSGALPTSCAACGATAKGNRVKIGFERNLLIPPAYLCRPSSKAVMQADIAQLVEQRIRNA